MIDKVNAKIPIIERNLSKVQQAGASTANAWYMPAGLGDLLMECVHEFVKAVTWLLEQVKELLKGALAPLYMWENAYTWENVRGVASGVAGEVTVSALGSTKDWTGASATAYTQAIAPQSAAASRLAAVADKTSTALSICAASGLVFYGAVAILCVQEVEITVGASVAAATGAAAPPALAVETTSALLTGAGLVGLIVGLLSLVGGQATQMTSIHGETIDTTAFPGGHWPTATTV
ncbi:hypothetical protein [Streptacidiphilus sp. EB129]|uniref:hypothetical protein n=1 Tax=Streptacidiphilus sp. EB129 TaxID=3156262 RepID=UPI0035189F47